MGKHSALLIFPRRAKPGWADGWERESVEIGFTVGVSAVRRQHNAPTSYGSITPVETPRPLGTRLPSEVVRAEAMGGLQ